MKKWVYNVYVTDYYADRVIVEAETEEEAIALVQKDIDDNPIEGRNSLMDSETDMELNNTEDIE